MGNVGFMTRFLGSAPGGRVNTIMPSADNTAVAIDATVLENVPGSVTLIVGTVVPLVFAPAPAPVDPANFELVSNCWSIVPFNWSGLGAAIKRGP